MGYYPFYFQGYGILCLIFFVFFQGYGILIFRKINYEDINKSLKAIWDTCLF